MNFERNNIAEHQILIDYKGVFSYDVISQLLVTLKEEMERLGEKVVTYKRILVIMIEVLENAGRYLDSHPEIKFDSQFLPTFRLTKNKNVFYIFSGNLVKNEDVIVLRNKIDHLNKASHEDLKKLYRHIISDGQFSNEGGAGLGFIEIAKTSNHKIEYSFEKVNELYVYYNINLELTN
jgi:predicted YcjX-like family ATPase